jgi:hypothetical protein
VVILSFAQTQNIVVDSVVKIAVVGASMALAIVALEFSTHLVKNVL